MPATLSATLDDGGRLACRVQPGAGLAVINPLSYGVTLDGVEAATGQAQFLRAMGSGSYLVTYDQRGFGASAAAAAPRTWDELGDDLWRVADAAGVERAVLYGVADGGYTIVHAARRQPERTLGMIFNFVPPTFASTSPSEGVTAERASAWFGSGDAPAGDTVAMMEELGIGGGDASELVRAWEATATERATAQARRMLLAADLRPLLSQIVQPSLVIAPRRRALFAAWGDVLASLLPNARLVQPARGTETLGAVQGFLALLGLDVGRRASQLSPALGRALLRGEQSMRELRRIAVAVDDDMTSARAVELACRLGEAQRSEIALVHVVPVPYTHPLDSPPPNLVKRGEHALSLGDAIVQRHGLPPPKRRLVCGRTIARTIISTAEELNTDLIVVANRGAADRSGSTSGVVDELLRRAPGKVVVDRADT